MATLEEIRNIFTSVGLPIATTDETELQRLSRLLWEVNSGSRTLASVAKSINYAATQQSGHRAWITEQWQYLYGRPPSEADLQRHTGYLAAGQPRAVWLANAEKHDADASITRIYQQALGRDPTNVELSGWRTQFRTGTSTRSALTAFLSNSTEAKNRPVPEEEVEGAVDARARLDGILEEFGLESLSGWAWEQIQLGQSETYILQELRKRPEYAARFPAMVSRREAGLAPISEAEYIEYEQSARQIMRQAGLPPGFYDSANDFTRLLDADLSLNELQSRVVEGHQRVVNAPLEVRAAFAELYGVHGDDALAAVFIDPEMAEQALLKQARSAEVKGWGTLFGYNFDMGEAERVGTVDLSTEEVRAGMAELQRMDPLFNESISEGDIDLSAEGEGAEAVFGLGGQGAVRLDRRLKTRQAALAGGGGANVDQRGVNLGAAD